MVQLFLLLRIYVILYHFMKLTDSFYSHEDVTYVAQQLLGKILYVNHRDGLCAGRIVETEAYSYREKACHAFMNRRTNRSETLFAPGGTAYVYLCYGIHNLFNVVTNEENEAEAVLIRALEPVKGLDLMKERRNTANKRQLSSGPGKLSQAMGIGLEHNKSILTGDEIWIENEDPQQEIAILSGPRIGIDYAEEDALLPWRYGLKGSVYLSRPFT
jgi:DNA-3-methyladenine glycosylase